MTEIKLFEGNQVEYIIENGEPLFEIYSTGMALGQVDKKILRSGECKIYPRKDRIEENVKNAGIAACVRDGHNYITEPQLYDLMLEMKTEKVKPFRKWITTEVLPSIRKTGEYNANPQKYPPKSTSAGEVANLTKQQDKIMVAQGSSPHMRAKAFEMLLNQFGIELPQNFVEPAYEQVVWTTTITQTMLVPTQIEGQEQFVSQ